jgi:hypothetical protein
MVKIKSKQGLFRSCIVVETEFLQSRERLQSASVKILTKKPYIDNRRYDCTKPFYSVSRNILIHIQFCTHTKFMSYNTESTKDQVQASLNITGTPFWKLIYNQDKLSTIFPKLDIPCVVLPKKLKYQEYRIENNGYAYLYRLRITLLNYHYSTNKTQLPVLRSLFSQRTLFRVSFSHIEWVKSCSKNVTKQEAPRQLVWRSEHDSAAPVNKFWVVSKYVKGGFPKEISTNRHRDRRRPVLALQKTKESFWVLLHIQSGSINKMEYQLHLSRLT